uniref:Chlorophyll a-b binding protein, chloroplastic n=1 Tax=Ginkgo biloba TaxID=3311 RepID=S4X0Q5_GINBI|nr:chloroplast chlorophyll a-b binding protein CP29 [Ginkgo biloba]|eukprot:Gb_13368 [translate_table: standard]
MAASLAASSSSFFTAQQITTVNNTSRVYARLNFQGFKKKAKPPPPPPKAKVQSERPMWLPGAQPPEWLDGSLVGDYGFDPLGLGKPAEYLQFDLDSLDQNLAKNEAGQLIGIRIEDSDIKPTPFQPYSEVFGLQRFRECELIHGRWAMLGTLGALAVEAFTGVTWQDAGKVELVEGSTYFGLPLPFNVSTLILIEVLLVGYIEFQRNAELDPEKRLYPGGKYFDPFGLAVDPDEQNRLKLAEIKHGRLAMVAFLIFAIQAAITGKGPVNIFVDILSNK